MTQNKPSLNDLKIERKEQAKSRWRLWLTVLVVLLAGIGVAGWLNRPKVYSVRTVAARQGASSATERTVLNASGYVTARRAATVSSKITGKVVEVLVEEGMKVREGQVLARLDDSNIKTSLALAQAQLVSARNALEETKVRITEAEQELERQRTLVKNKIATQADYDHAEASALALKARLDQQQADITVAEKQVAVWQQQLDDTVIRAPFSGVVTVKNAQPGEMISPVSAGSGFTRTGICTLVDMDSLEIEVDVNESYINRVEPGQEVQATLDAYPDWKIPSKVIAIIPTADRQKSTVKVRVAFNQLDPRMLPEMGVKVAFREQGDLPGASSGMALIPKGAVHEEGGRDVVFVFQDGRAERRAVTIAGADGEDKIVSAGLNPGDKVILDWPAGLKEGSRVKEL